LGTAASRSAAAIYPPVAASQISGSYTGFHQGPEVKSLEDAKEKPRAGKSPRAANARFAVSPRGMGTPSQIDFTSSGLNRSRPGTLYGCRFGCGSQGCRRKVGRIALLCFLWCSRVRGKQHNQKSRS
jgi:hypothetical protein